MPAASLSCCGWDGFDRFMPSPSDPQEVRALLGARKLLQHKLIDIEMSIRGILRGFGLKVGKVTDTTFERRIRELVAGHKMLEDIAAAMLRARATLLAEFTKLHKAVLRIVRQDEV